MRADIYDRLTTIAMVIGGEDSCGEVKIRWFRAGDCGGCFIEMVLFEFIGWVSEDENENQKRYDQEL